MAAVNDVLDPSLYSFPFAAIRLRPWVYNPTTKLFTRGTGDFTPIGDCDDVKTSWEKEEKERKSRNQKTQVTVFKQTTSKTLNVGWKAMQWSGFTLAMAMYADIAGLSEDALAAEIEVGEADQYDMEVEIEALTDGGAQGTLTLYRVPCGPTGDRSWAGGDDFAGQEFSGTALRVPGLGKNGKPSFGKFVPFGVAAA